MGSHTTAAGGVWNDYPVATPHEDVARVGGHHASSVSSNFPSLVPHTEGEFGAGAEHGVVYRRIAARPRRGVRETEGRGESDGVSRRSEERRIRGREVTGHKEGDGTRVQNEQGGEVTRTVCTTGQGTGHGSG